MKIINVEQGTKEWFDLRKGLLTASHAQAIAANGKGLITYVKEKMCEVYSTAEKETYSNKAMENGVELEEYAAIAYEFETGRETERIGFVKYNDYIGASPDRIVGDDGLVEIKCPSDKTFFNLLLDNKIDSKYMWQMQMQMLITERKWCDYVVYNPNFDKSLVIIRVLPDEKKFQKLLEGFKAGEALIKEIRSNMEGLK
jgi:putative phage-type endonuclease